MDVKEFIHMALTQIVAGVAKAAADVEEEGSGAVIADTDRGQFVQFDLAVTYSEQAGAEGGIQVWGFKAGVDTANQSSTVSRIQFKVPIHLPGVD